MIDHYGEPRGKSPSCHRRPRAGGAMIDHYGEPRGKSPSCHRRPRAGGAMIDHYGEPRGQRRRGSKRQGRNGEVRWNWAPVALPVRSAG